VGEAHNDRLDELNPIFMMANSGARGSFSQIRQLASQDVIILQEDCGTEEFIEKPRGAEPRAVRESRPVHPATVSSQ
jgi:RNA polymerase Rpb1, domain 4